MSGPDQPAEPYRPYRPQDGVEADESETMAVDARELGADESAQPAAADVPQAWSNSAQDNAPTTAMPYPRAYRPVDEDDPTDAPLADTPGSFGGAPVPESADVRAASPYAARPVAESTPGSTPDESTQHESTQHESTQHESTQHESTQHESTTDRPTADGPTTADSQDDHGDLFPSAGASDQTSSTPASSPRADGPQTDAVPPTPPQPAPAQPETGMTQGSGSTAAYQPFQSTAQPAVAPFPSGTTTSGTASTGDAPDDATRAIPKSAVAQDPFARPYPDAAQPLAQPEYIPPPQPQPVALDERDTFIGQSARPEEPDLLPEKRRIWQNLLGALIGLVLVLGPIVGFALLAGTPDSLFDAALARRFLLLGIIVVAAAPALLAGWAPATAWLPGGILAVVGSIAFLSNSFTAQLRSWSMSLFDTEVAGVFVAQYAVVIGFVLLFAGLGTAWARNSGAESVIRRIPTRS